MYSKTAAKLLENKIGYREESYSGSHIRNLYDVIEFEIEELGNEDILYFLKCNEPELHDLPDPLTEDDDIPSILKRIDKFVKTKLGSTNVSAIWLTSYKYVKKWYEGEDESIDMYSIPANFVILSDLNDEGILLAVTTEDFGSMYDPEIKIKLK